jgi:hypothetical protein
MFFGGRVVNLILHSKARFHDIHTNQGLLIGAPTRTAGDFIGGVSADPGATHKPKVMGSEVSGHGVSDSGVEPGIFSQNNTFNVPPLQAFLPGSNSRGILRQLSRWTKLCVYTCMSYCTKDKGLWI